MQQRQLHEGKNQFYFYCIVSCITHSFDAFAINGKRLESSRMKKRFPDKLIQPSAES